MFCLLHFVSHLSHLRWVNKLHSNASRFSAFFGWLISMLLFAFFAAISPFVSSDKVSYCNAFFLLSLPCLQELFCKTNFITNLTLLLHQLQTLEIVSGNEVNFVKKKKRRKEISHFIFHCFRIIVVIVAGAIQLMRFYWKKQQCFVPKFSEAFITHLNISSDQVSFEWADAMFKKGNKLMDFQFNFAFLSVSFLSFK